jgi:hypothetical protein
MLGWLRGFFGFEFDFAEFFFGLAVALFSYVIVRSLPPLLHASAG